MKTSESSICLYIHAYSAKRDIVKHKKKYTEISNFLAYRNVGTQRFLVAI